MAEAPEGRAVRRLTLYCCLLSLCLTAALAAPVPKSKDSSAFKGPGWGKPIDPDKDCKFTFKTGSLTIEVPAKGHEFKWVGKEKSNAPMLLRDVAGDFEAEVRVTADPAQLRGAAPGAYLGAGLVVVSTGKGATTLLLDFGKRLGEEAPLTYLWFSQDGTGPYLSPGRKGWPLAPDAKAAYLRLRRQGGRLVAAAGPDGARWPGNFNYFFKDDSRSYALPAGKVKVGLFARSTSGGKFKVTFDKFKLTPLKAKAK
jgi:regulation of enolase protein 1 (concanavalin A-like superfamily)